MTRIDQALCTVAWEEIYSEAVIQTLSSSSSDHCPLLLQLLAQVQNLPIFRFESHWPDMPGFTDRVQTAWEKPVEQNLNPMMTLHVKLSKTAKALWSWSRTLIPQGKLAAIICREVILQLDKAQGDRQLSVEEQELKTQLKNRILGLAAIERSRARKNLA